MFARGSDITDAGSLCNRGGIRSWPQDLLVFISNRNFYTGFVFVDWRSKSDVPSEQWFLSIDLMLG